MIMDKKKKYSLLIFKEMKKNYTFSLDSERLSKMQEWFIENKPIKYNSFNHFAEIALEKEFLNAIRNKKG